MRRTTITAALAITAAASAGEPSLEVRLYADQDGSLIGPGQVAGYASGDTVRFVLRAEFTADPGAYFGFLRVDLTPDDPVFGRIKNFQYGDWARVSNPPRLEQASLLDVEGEQAALLGPVDASNPLVICEFDLVLDPGPFHFTYEASSPGDVAFGLYPDGGLFTIPLGFDTSAFSAVTVFAGGGPGPCNEADLAHPFGVLDLDDLHAFIDAFILGNPEADLAPPFGTLDLADVQAFVAAFLAGCP